MLLSFCLGAYNLFFKEERAKMLAANADDDGIPDKTKKIGFETMAKTIGSRWKGLEEAELARYKEMAQKDMERYRKEMDQYHLDLAKKSRIEREEAAKRAEQAEKDGILPPGSTAAVAGTPDANSQLEQLMRAQMMAGQTMGVYGFNPMTAALMYQQQQQVFDPNQQQQQPDLQHFQAMMNSAVQQQQQQQPWDGSQQHLVDPQQQFVNAGLFYQQQPQQMVQQGFAFAPAADQVDYLQQPKQEDDGNGV